MSKYVLPGICAGLDATSEQLISPRPALGSGTKYLHFGKYVKIVPKELSVLPGAHTASCNDLFFIVQNSDKKSLTKPNM